MSASDAQPIVPPPSGDLARDRLPDNWPNAQPNPEVTARLGVLLFLVSLGALFAALAAIFLYRLGDRLDYRFEAPRILWASTAAILLSDIAYFLGQRAIRRDLKNMLLLWVGGALALGIAFTTMQALAWVELLMLGITAQSNPFSGMFYLFTAIHALHVAVGLGLLVAVLYGAYFQRYSAGRRSFVDLAGLYWRFLNIVWLGLFYLLVIL